MATPALPLDAPAELFVRNGDIEIATYSYGDRSAPTVILVHGWPDSHHLWDDVVPLLTDDYHVVTYDTRGAGRTTNPVGTHRFKLAELASDLVAVADAVSPDHPVHVVGHDWGSIQTWEAVCEPGAERRLASFTSISGPNLDHSGRWIRRALARPTPRNLRGPLRQFGASWYLIFFQIPVLPPLLVKAVASQRRWKQFLARTEGLPAERVHLGDSFETDMVHGIRLYRANMKQRIARPRERRTSVPIQLLVNTRDLAIRPENFTDYANWTERLWRHDIDAGHWLPFSRPELIASAVRELIASVEGQRG